MEAIKNVTINEPFFNGHFPPSRSPGTDHRVRKQAAGIWLVTENKKPADGFNYLLKHRQDAFKRQVLPATPCICLPSATKRNIHKFVPKPSESRR